jgi:subtilisin-like proprotein convertase family protein
LYDQPISDVIAITGAGPFLSLKVTLDIQHSYFSDLFITLTRESDGAALTLHANGVCSQLTDTRVNLTFADSACGPVGVSCYGTQFQASGGSLNGFVSANSADGNWRLEMIDWDTADDGVLNGWCLDFDPTVPEPTATVISTTTLTLVETSYETSTETFTETACTATVEVPTTITSIQTTVSTQLVPTTLTTVSVSLVPTTATLTFTTVSTLVQPTTVTTVSTLVQPTTLTTVSVSLVPTTLTLTKSVLGAGPQTIRLTSTLVKTRTRWSKTKTSTLSKCTKTKTKTTKVTKCTKTVLKTVTRTLVPRKIAG